MESPYLNAIQRLPGVTAGEKYRTLNRSARKLADASKRHEDTSSKIEEIILEEFSEALLPLVNLEIANILQQPDGIVDALKSDDELVFSRALKVKWFFDGTNKDITNIQYFENKIFPYVSLNNRIKLVKILASYLRPMQPTIAEEFYTKLVGKYKRSLSEPLLVACSPNFIKNNVLKSKIVLNLRAIRIIFLRYPKLVIEYFKMSKLKEDMDPVAQQTQHKINILEYKNFLPRLLKNHANAFVELILMHDNSLGIKLSRRQTEFFLKYVSDALLKNPKLFMPMMPLKLVTANLAKLQFNQLFKELFPKKIKDFDFAKMYKYLEYYPEEECMTLILSVFENIYGISLLECTDKISPLVLRLLGPEERSKQAKKKLKGEINWHTTDSWNYENSWTCYLSVEESIPAIKNQISKSSLVNDRCELIKQLIYTCKVNKDDNALLEVLKYMITRFKNEQGWAIIEVLEGLLKFFKAETLSNEHWDILEDFIRLLRVKNELISRLSIAQKLIVTAIHSRLIRNKEINEYINLYIELVASNWNPSWNIILENPEYERICLVAFLTSIPVVISSDDLIAKLIISAMSSVYEFNDRNSKAKVKLENLSIRNFEWLANYIEKLCSGEIKTNGSRNSQLIKKKLKNGEPDLYNAWNNNDDDSLNIQFEDTQAITLLKRDPKKISDNWEKYLEKCVENIDCKLVQRFLLSCRWYQDLPIKFVGKTLTELTENKDDRSLLVLALLYEGSIFEKILIPFIPITSTIDIKDTTADDDYSLYKSIPLSLNIVNPPVSLDLIEQFCVGDYFPIIINCLINVGGRVAVDKVIEFSKKLMTQRVSIKKQGIRLFCLVASLDQLREMLKSSWNTESHRSIKAVIYEKIFNLFVTTPSQETWSIMRDCISQLTIDDDALGNISKLSQIPAEFIAEYVSVILALINKLENIDKSLTKQAAVNQVNKILQNAIGLSALFPEELQQHILTTYFADLSKPEYALSSGTRNYVINGYLCSAGKKLESRLVFFAKLFLEIVEKYWDIPEVTSPRFFPGNIVVYRLIKNVYEMKYSTVKMRIVQVLLDSFLKVLKPQQAAISYLGLVFSTLIDDKKSSKELFERIVKVIPSLVKTFSNELIALITGALDDRINKVYSQDSEANQIKLDIIENLIETNEENLVIFAATMLLYGKINSTEQFCNIIKKLKTYKHPAIVAAVYHRINSFSPVQNLND